MRYSTFLSDSARWDGFDFRAGDIIISTPAKCGTTWTQMICGLLIFQTPEFPDTMDRMSPWLEMRTRRKAEVHALYEAQTHRRFIKSHTPLDGLPVDQRITYITVGRDPRDVALSWNGHMDNIDVAKIMGALVDALEPDDALSSGDTPEPPSLPPPPIPEFETPQDAFLHWVDQPAPDGEVSMNLAGTIRHLAGFWTACGGSPRPCRGDTPHPLGRDRPDVVLLHYDDLQADLEGEMRRLAERLDIKVPEDRWPALVKAASFGEMRRRAELVAPDTGKAIWKSTEEFFHKGTSGQWRGVFDDGALAHYEARVRELAPPDLAAWLHHGNL